MSTARAVNDLRLNPDEYLSFENDASIRHEYLRGVIVAMTGASDSHVQVSLNLAFCIKSKIKGSDCRVYISDMKVRINKGEAFFYPDVMVTCNAADRTQTHYKDSPKLTVEVISPSYQQRSIGTEPLRAESY